MELLNRRRGESDSNRPLKKAHLPRFDSLWAPPLSLVLAPKEVAFVHLYNFLTLLHYTEKTSNFLGDN